MEGLNRYLNAGEGINIEFKRCGSNKVEADVLETICSFANRQGGSILLGVLDGGEVVGVSEQSVKSIERNIANSVNNPNLFNVSPSLEFEHFDIGSGRVVIRVWVPMSPSVCTFKKVIYDRLADTDNKLTPDQASSLILRKQNYFTERRVYPWVSKDDLEIELLDEVRSEIRAAQGGNHSWLTLDNDSLLAASGLYGRDPITGKRGYNLACLVLFGKEAAILDALPVYRTDVVLRRSKKDRYDDRLVTSHNLVRAYKEICDFCNKWLPDVFVLDGVMRVSARDTIVRELVGNSLIHREYTSPSIARIEIDADGIHTRNASRALFSGPVNPDNLDPTPKNPLIARLFTQMGRAEELGSGTRNLFRLSPLYSGKNPKLEEGDFFTAFVPVPAVAGVSKGPPDRLSRGTAAEVAGAVEGLLAEVSAVTVPMVAAEVSSVGERTVRRYMNELAEEGTLVKMGKGRYTKYSFPS